jgi:hypothetical protein
MIAVLPSGCNLVVSVLINELDQRLWLDSYLNKGSLPVIENSYQKTQTLATLVRVDIT